MFFRRRVAEKPGHPEEKRRETAAAAKTAAEAVEEHEITSVEEYFRSAIAESVLIRKDVLVDLYKGFEKLLKFVGGLLYTSAKDAGKLMAQRLVEQGIMNKDNVIDLMFDSFVVAGYADELEVSKVEVKGDKTVIEVTGKGMLLGSRMKSKNYVDQPLAGYMAGWLESFYGAKVNAREVACQARGDPACVIRIEIREPHEELLKYQGKKYERRRWLKLMEAAECPESSN